MTTVSSCLPRSDYHTQCEGAASGVLVDGEISAHAYECSCGKTFKRRAPYERHLEIAHSSTTCYKCSRCGKTFGNENTLTMHMSVHDNKAPFGDLVSQEQPASPDEDSGDKETTHSDKENMGESESVRGPAFKNDARVDNHGLDLRVKQQQQQQLSKSANNFHKDLSAVAQDLNRLLQNIPTDIASAYPSLSGRLAAPVSHSQVTVVSAPEPQPKFHVRDRPATVSVTSPAAPLPNIITSCSPAVTSRPSPGCDLSPLEPGHFPAPPVGVLGDEGLPQGVQIKKEVIEDDMCFSEDTAHMMHGLTEEELQMVEHLQQLDALDEAAMKREIEESQMSEAEKQVLRKSHRRRTANPIWKSLLTGKMYDKALDNADKKETPEDQCDLMDTSEMISVSMEALKPENGDVFCDDNLVYVTPESLKKAKRSRKGKGSISNNNTFECYVCGKVFISEKYLSMHISLHGTVKSEVEDEMEGELQAEEYMQCEEPPSPLALQTEICPDGAPPKKVVRKVSKGSEQGWTCNLCSKTFAHNSGYKNHMRTHSNERPYVCSLCDIGFKEKYHLKKHNLFIHSTELPEKCRVCGKRFKDSTAVRAHERIHSDARPFGCRRCGKSFKTSECLWHHEHRSKTCGATYGEPQPVEKGPRKRRKFPKTDPLEYLDKKEPYAILPPEIAEVKLEPKMEVTERYLPMCPQSPLQQQQPLQHHHNPHQQPSPPLCNSAPEMLYDLSSIPTMVQSMDAEQPYAEDFPEDLMEADLCASSDRKLLTCSVCAKSFVDHASFARHAKVHTEERPFVCTKCDIGFKMKVHLKKHVLYVHSDDYPCECQFCGKRFKDSSAVKLHERTHSDTRPFQCAGCGKAFKTRENLWGHQHRGKCIHAGSREQPVNGTLPPKCAQVSIDNNGVTAHASVSNNVYAQAYVSTSQVTARAIIENNQVTAHASFANNHVTAHASLVNNQVTAHAVINNVASAQESGGNVNYRSPKYGCTSSPTPGTVPTSSMNGVHINATQNCNLASPPRAPQYSPPAAQYSPPAKEASVQYLHPKVTEALKGPLLAPAQVVNMGAKSSGSPAALPHMSAQNTSSLPATPTSQHTSPNAKWPTLKEFLQRGVEGLKTPVVAPGPPTWFDPTTGLPMTSPTSSNSPPATATTTAPKQFTPSTEYPTIKERLMRGFTKATTCSLSAGTSPTPSVTYSPPGAPVPFIGGPAGCGGAIPSFQSTFLGKPGPPPPLTPLSSPSPLIRSEDPSIPIIYWDDDADSRAPPSVHSWHSDSEAMLRDIQETVLTQL